MGNENSFLTRTFRELKRRRVFRVAAAYGVLSWAVVEISSIVAPALFLPDWSQRLVIYLVLLGLPVALFLAWAYDVTPEGVVRTGSATDDELKTDAPRSGRRIDFAVIAVLVSIIAWQFFSPGTSESATEITSIAVLPFVDLSEKNDAEYFSDGMSEELLNALVRVDGLRVAARTSSFAFKDKDVGIRTIGRELNVDTVLEGSVRKSGNRVRITAQLIDVDSGFHLWSETFDRPLDDIFAIQNDIAKQIVAALELKLGGGKEVAIATAPTSDIRAYELYLLGRHNWHQRTPDSLERALDMFEQAIALDDEFALAYTGIADTYLLLAEYAGFDHDEVTDNAEPAIARALYLNDELAEAYASMGLLRLHLGELVAAELALRKSISLNPQYSMAHMWLGLALQKDAGLQSAYREFKAAKELDPLHPVINQNLADALGNMGRFEDAAARIQKVIEQQPGSARGYFALAKLTFNYGKFDETIRLLDGIEDDDEDYSAYARGFTAMSYAALGDFERARSLIDALLTESPDNYELANMAAYGYFMMGDMAAVGSVTDGTLKSIGDWKTAELNYKERLALIWPGVARVMLGDFDEGAAMLERALLSEPGLHADPAEMTFLLSSLAYAYEQTGRVAEAERLWQQSLDRLARATGDGWARPDFAAARAMVLLAQDRDEEAYEALSRAVTAGWKHYWFTVNMPVIRDNMDLPQLRALMSEVKSELDVMRNRLDERVTRAAATSNADT